MLDEPTVGLHMAEVGKLIRVLHRLVDTRHDAAVIEQDLDGIAAADWWDGGWTGVQWDTDRGDGRVCRQRS